MPDMIFTWMTDDGPKRFEELSREEMLDALHQLAEIAAKYHSPRSIRARAYGEVEMLKRGA